jgi:signal transduction histidine kinase
MIFAFYLPNFSRKHLKWLDWNSLWTRLTVSMIAIVLLQWVGFAVWTKWVMMHGMVSISPFMWEPLLKQLMIVFVVGIPTLLILICITIQRTLKPLFNLQSWILHRRSSLPRYLPRELQDVANTYQQLSTSVAATQTWQCQFTTQVSHELRTPLSVVYGYLQSTLRRSENLTESQRAALQTALQETEHTLELLKSLLMFARSQAAPPPVTFQHLSLQSLVLEAIQHCQTLLQRPIHLQNHHPEAIVWSDRELLIQMIVHLMHQVDQELAPAAPIAIAIHQTQTDMLLAIPHAVKVEGKGLHLLMVQSLATTIGAQLQLVPTPQMDYDLSILFPIFSGSGMHSEP